MKRLTSSGAMRALGLLYPLITAAQPPAAQSGSPPELSPELYQKVLDTAFPLPPEIAPDVVLTMSIRITEAFGGISQINMTLYRSRGPEVESLITVKKVSQALAEATKAGEDISPPSLVKHLMVSRKFTKVDAARIFAWQQGFLRSWAATLPILSEPTIKLCERRPVSILLDADAYEIRYSQFGTKMHGTFIGSKSEGPAIATWAEEVREEVAKGAR